LWAIPIFYSNKGVLQTSWENCDYALYKKKSRLKSNDENYLQKEFLKENHITNVIIDTDSKEEFLADFPGARYICETNIEGISLICFTIDI
jgi:hypothetical protein